MSAQSQAFPRAFAVWFKDLHRWDVRSQNFSAWDWPITYLKPALAAMERVKVVVDRKHFSFDSIQLISINFDGEIIPRKTKSKTEFAGDLFFAQAGDIVYSKIDLRNGAIGIVPKWLESVAVSSEFPVYRARKGVASSEYIKLVFRSAHFRRTLARLISGTSGRKRVQPSIIETLTIPLLPLPIQQAIVDRWKQAQDEFETKTAEALGLVENIDFHLLRDLNIKLKPPLARKGAFAVRWQDLERWDTLFYRADFTHLNKMLENMPHAPLGRLANFTSRPWHQSDFPNGNFRYVEISSVSKKSGITDTRIVETKNPPSRATTLLHKGDLIIATTRPYLGAFAIVTREYDRCVCSSAFALIDQIDDSLVNKEFLLFFLKSSAGLRQMEQRMTGGLYPAIVQDELEKINVPLVPLQAQEKIVSAIQMRLASVSQILGDTKIRNEGAITEIEAMILGTKKLPGWEKYVSQ